MTLKPGRKRKKKTFSMNSIPASMPKNKREAFDDWSKFIRNQLGNSITLRELWCIYLMQECNYTRADIIYRTGGNITINDIRNIVKKFPYLRGYFHRKQKIRKGDDALDRECVPIDESFCQLPEKHMKGEIENV